MNIISLDYNFEWQETMILFDLGTARFSSCGSVCIRLGKSQDIRTWKMKRSRKQPATTGKTHVKFRTLNRFRLFFLT